MKSEEVGLVLKRARQEAARLERKHAAATQLGQRHKAWALRKKMLASFNVRLAAVEEANKRLRKCHRVPLVDLPRVAEQLDAWRPSNEEVRVTPKAKRSGGWRPIMSFGLLERARQVLVRRALKPITSPTPDQYAMRGHGGRDAAARAVSQAIRDGYEWAVELDIKDCYPSFKNEVVAQVLPLPREVVGNVTSPARMNLIPRKCTPLTLGPLQVLAQSQRGLPQGSALSPWIAEMVIGYVLRRTSLGAGRVFTFADNILLMARSKRELMSMRVALRSAFKRCSVGRFQLTSKEGIQHVSAGFNFLGYRFSGLLRKVQITPTRDNVTKLRRKLWKLVREHASEAAWSKTIRAWAAAFSLNTWGAERDANFIAMLVRLRASEAEPARPQGH